MEGKRKKAVDDVGGRESEDEIQKDKRGKWEPEKGQEQRMGHREKANRLKGGQEGEVPEKEPEEVKENKEARRGPHLPVPPATERDSWIPARLPLTLGTLRHALVPCTEWGPALGLCKDSRTVRVTQHQSCVTCCEVCDAGLMLQGSRPHRP